MAITYNLGTAEQLSATAALAGAAAVTTGDQIVISGITKYDTLTFDTTITGSIGVRVVNTNELQYTSDNGVTWTKIGSVDGGDGRAMTITFVEADSNTLDITDVIANTVMQALLFDTNTTTGTIADDRAIAITFNGGAIATDAAITVNMAGTTSADKIIYTTTMNTSFDAGGTADDTLIVESGLGAISLNSGANAALATAIATFENIDASAANSAVTLVMDSAFKDVKLGLAADTIQIAVATDMGTVTINGGAGRDTLELTADGLTIAAADLAKLTSVEILKTAAGDNSITLGATNSIDTINASAGVNTTIDAKDRTVNNAAVGDYDLTITTAGGDDIVTISQGKDNINLGAGDNTLNIATANLDANDVIVAGAGTADKIVLTTGDIAIVDSQFTGVSGFEELDGVDTATTITLGDHAKAAGITKVDVTTSTGAATVDISTMNTNANMTILGSNNNLTIVTKADHLTTDDTFTGGTGADVLELKTSGTVDATDLTNVTLIETLNITATNGAVSVTIGDGNDFKLIDSTSSTGNNTIDASAELDVTGGIIINTGSGNDTITTGATTTGVTIDAGNGDNIITLGTATNGVTAGNGDDTVTLVDGTDTLNLGAGENLVTVDYANFTVADSILGSGTNTLKFNDATTDDGTLTTVESKFVGGGGNKIDIIELGADATQIVTLGTNAKADGVVQVDGSALLTGHDLTVDLIAMDPTAGTFTVKGGAGDDTVKINSTSLTATTSLQMGVADTVDTLEIADVATIIDTDFTLSTSLEKLTFAIDGAHSITLGDKAKAAGITTIDTSMTVEAVPVDQIIGSTIDLSSATTNTDFTITMGKGDDTITMRGVDLTSGDTIDAGLGVNTLSLKGVSNIADAAFTNVDHIGKVILDAGNNQSLVYSTNAIAAGILEIDGSLMGTGNTINVAAADVIPLKVTTGAGDDTVIISDGSTTVDASFTINLGNGNNTVKTQSAYLTSGDIIVGGSGTDILEVTNAATLVDLSFGGMTNFETLKLANGANSVELGAKAQTAGLLTIDGSAMTGANALTATIIATDDTKDFNITGGAAADTIKITSALLDDLTFNGAGGTDIIELTSASALTDASFAHLSNIETLKLNDFATAQTITLGDASNVATNANNSGLSTIDASGLLGSNKVTIDLSGVIKDLTVTTAGGDDTITMSRGNDDITTGGGDDIIKVTGELLQASDVIDGGADSVFGDTLEITNTTTNITDALFANKTNLEILKLSSTTGTYNITLGTAAVDAGITQISIDAGVKATIDISAADGVIKVVGAGASDVVLTTGSLVDDVTLGGGADTVKIASANLTSADHYTFGAGTDILEVTTAATVIDADFTNITGLDTVKVGDFANSVIIGDIASVAGVNKVDLANVTTTTNAQTVDFSTMTHDGTFTVTGGAGVDTVKMRAEDLTTADNLSGGGSTDILEFTTVASGKVDADFTNVTGFETLQLVNSATTQSLTLGTQAFDGGNGIKTVDGDTTTGKLTVTLTAASDITILGGSGATEVTMAAANLTTADTITGGAGALDKLILNTAATSLGTSNFTGVSGVEILELQATTGAQSVVLGAGFTTVDAHTTDTAITIDGATTASLDLSNITTGSANDTLKIQNGDFTSADSFAFGGGTDTLEISDTATVIDTDFTNVTGLETIKTTVNVTGQSVELSAKSLTAGVNKVDFTSVTNTAHTTTTDLSNMATPSTLTVLGSAGADTIKIKAANLTTTDTFTGGTGTDIIELTTAATVNLGSDNAVGGVAGAADSGFIDTNFTNVTGFEILKLADGASQSLILGDKAFGLVSGGLTTVNATALTGTNSVSIDMTTATNDHNVTINTSVAGTGADTVTMKAAHLTTNDTIALGAGTGDKLVLTTAATNVAVTAFTNVSGVEILELQATTGAQSVVLGAGFTTVDAHTTDTAITIDGATTASLDLSNVTTGTGDDTLKLQNADFTSADVFAFGTGTDTLQIMDTTTIIDADFTLVTGLEVVKSGDFSGQTVALSDLAIAAGVTKIDYSAITNTQNSTATTLSGTTDSTIKIIGGLGADNVTMKAGHLTSSDTLTGSDGIDTLTFSTAATLLDAAFTEVTGFETLVLADADAQTLVLGDQAFNGGSGIKTINGGTLVTGSNAVSIDMSSATTDNAISITTGVGADTITMKAAHLTSSDVLNGGTGNDILAFTDAANLTADKFANVTSFKTLELQATAGTQDVALVSGFDTVDATVATADVTIDTSTNGTTDLTITTGTGADTIKIAASTLNGSDDIEGGDGVDTLEVIGVNDTTASITDAKIAALTHVEVIKLTNPATPTSIVLGTNASANGINKVDASGTASVNTINLSAMTTAVEVVGGAGADSVTAAGITATNANNTIKTGLGDDTVTIDAQTLDSSDILWGEGGTDTLILTGDASGLTAADFTNVKGFESIKLSDGTGISMILGSDADLNNIIKVDASSVTVGHTITTDISGYEIVTDVDNFTYVGGAGDDTFKLQSTHLNKDDILSGGAGTSDILEFTTVAINSTDSSIFNNVTGFETLKLADVAGAQTVTLKNEVFTTIDASANTNTGAITVDSSNVVGDITIKTAGGADIITAAKGDNTIESGLGNDTIKVNSTTFDASDDINGGDGTDTIEFSGSKTTITDAMFANKTSVESLKVLVDESGQVITLATNANAAGINTVDTTTLTKGITVDASGMTLGMTISTASGADIIKAGNGADTIKAGDGNDTITIKASKLTSADVIWGEAGTADTLQFSDVATLDDSAFTGVKTIESLKLNSGDQAITMGANAITSGIKTIDASNLIAGDDLALNISDFTQDTTIIGGAGNETVTLKASTLNGSDDINLGTGTDKVIFTDVLTSAPTLTKLTGVETIQLADGNNQLLTLNDDIGTTLTIDGSALVDINKVTIDGSVLGTKTTHFTVNTSTGGDTITLGGSINAISTGGGDDTIKTAMANLTDADADTINGGSGTNTLEITTGGTLSDAKLLNVTNIQSVKLSTAVTSDYSLTLGTNAGTNNIVNIDGSSLTTGKLSIDASTLGNEIVNFKGGDANDTFIIAGAQLNSSDTIDGKSTTDTDILMIKDGSSTATTIIDSAFTNVTNIEKLTYGESANHSLTAGDKFKASGIKTVDASALATTKTFAMNLDTMTTDMDLTVVGSNGIDTITMKGAHLTASDVLKLGTGANVLELSGAATLTNANFAATSTGVTTLKFTENYAQDLTIGANAITGGLTTVDATAVLTAGSSITVDSAVTANLTINTGGGIDTITLAGGNSTINSGAGNDIIKITATNLTADDVINGGAHTTKDILDITTAGTLADTQFAHVTNIEEIKLSQDASQSLTFGANFTTSGITSVDASALTAGKSLTLNISGMTIDKNMTVLGGAGDDTVTILGSSLDKNDTIVFGSGADKLAIASASAGTTTITDEDFTNISGVETVAFTQYHNKIEFGDNMVDAGVVKIDASGNTATGYATEVDMTEITTVFTGYTILGGEGNDTFTINANQLAATTVIDGGGNNTSRGDILQFATSVNFSDADDFAGVSKIETIKLADGDGQKIVLKGGLTSVGNSLTLDGSSLTGTNSVEVVVVSTVSENITITTNGGDDTISLATGADTVTLGGGDDTVTIISANLTSGDKIDFGTGTDTLILSTLSELADSDFTNIAGLEKITLGDFANGLTLGDFAKASGLQEVDGTASTNNLTLNMSSMASNIDLTVTGGSGDDTITMKGIHFQQTDNLDGGTGDDILELTGDSSILDIAFTNTSSIETLKLGANATYAIVLGAEAEEAGITAIDTSAVNEALSIDISAMTIGMTIDGKGVADTIIMGQANDTVNTGAGDDTIKVASGYLTSADTVNGAGDNDQLIFTTTISSTDSTIFDGVTNVEKLVLSDGDGQTVTLRAGANNFTTIDALALSGSSAITIDASLTASNLKILTAGGDDIIIAGDTIGTNYEVSTSAGDDTIQFTSSGVITSADKIYGGVGTDTLEFTSTSTASSITDTAFFGTHITGIEILKLGDVTGNSVALGAKATVSGIRTVDTTSVATTKAVTVDLSAMAVDMTVNGGAGNDTVTAGTKNDTLTLGAGDDTVKIKNAQLTANDIIDGGAGTNDIIEITETVATIVTDAMFTNVSNIEKLSLKGNATKTITLGENADFSGLNEVLVDSAVTAIVNINASAISGDFSVTTAGGADIITVGTGDITVDAGAGNDTVKIAGTTFDVNDTIDGGAGTGDILLFTDAAILTDTELNQITGIETIKFSDVSGQSVEIGDNAKTNGLKVFDGSAITSANSITMDLSSMATNENMVLSGGAGKDTFIMVAGHFNTSDTLAGGAGVDTLEFTTAVTSDGTFDTYFEKTTGIENIVLADFTAQIFTLGTKAQTAGVSSVDATTLSGENYVTITASAITSALSVETAGGDDIIKAGNGLDSYILGSGNDTITFKSASLNKDLVDGGEGSDLLIISDLANIVDASLANVSKIEKIKLSNAVGDSKITFGTFAQDAGILELDGSLLTGTSTIDISNVTVDNFSITTGTGIDNITLGSGINTIVSGDGNDIITVRAEDFTSDDKINGGSDNDTLIISTASADTTVPNAIKVIDADFTNVTAIETIKLSNFANQSITLGSNAKNAGITTLDATASGNVTVDLSGIEVSSFTTNTGKGADTIILGKANDMVNAGAGNDTVKIKNEDLNASDNINFGGGDVDILEILDKATIIDEDFTNIIGIDILKINNFANQTINFGALASEASVDIIDAESLTNSISIDASGYTKELIITSGTGDDSISLSSSNLANFTIDGGAGIDTVYITDRANITDLKVANISNIEKIVLADFNNQVITLGAKASTIGLTTFDATALTANSNININLADFTSSLTLNGGAGDDTVTIKLANTSNADVIALGTGSDTLILSDRANTTAELTQEVQTIELTGTATGAVSFLGSVVASSVNTDSASVTAGRIVADKAAIMLAWNTAHTTQEIQDITASGTTITVTYKNTEGDVSTIDTATSNGITFGTSIQTTQGSLASTDFEAWLGGNGSGLSSIENLTLSNFANQSLVLGTNAKTLGITTVQLTSTKGNAVTVDATLFASALTINTLDGNHTITTATGAHNDIIRTGLGVDTITLDGGDDDIYTGSGNDTINISTTNLTSADKIDGGLGIDTLALSGVDSTTHAVIDSMFDTLKGIEIIKLNTDTNQKVTIGESARLAGVTTIDGSVVGTGFNLDASAFKGNLVATGSTNSDIITAGKGIDTITTGDNADTINFSSIYLNRYDKVDGGLGIDTLVVSDKATITDDKFTSLKSIEVLKLGANVSGQTITLGKAAMKAGITTLDLRGIDGANYKVNTVAFTNPLEILVDRQGGTFVTSAKNDTLTIDAAVFHNTISFTAGLGSDTIKINTAATGTDVIIDDDFTKLVGVETLALTQGGTITLAPKAVLAGIRTLDLTNSANATVVNAESFSNAGLNVILSQMADDVETGLNNDTITTTDANLTAADTINMGTQLTNGVDTVYITDTASITSAELNKISNAEVLKLGNATGHDVDFTGTTNTTMIKVDGTLMKAGQTSLVNVTGKTAQVEVLMGAGNDIVEMSKADFGLYKTTLTQKNLTGGTGTDTILISDSATGIIDTDFIFKSKVLGFETIGLGNGGTVTIGANAAKAGITKVDVSTSSADSTILTGGITKAVTVTLGNNDDRVETGIGADTVNIEGANLDSNDKIWLGAGNDTLNILGDASGLNMTQMGGVINVETLKLSDATTVGQTVDISSLGFYFVTFDGTAMTTGSTIVDVHGMTTKTTVLLGKGADTVKMLNADVLATTKAINGGAGIDTLKITDAATLTDASFATKKIAAFETINLAGSLVAGANFVSTGISNIEASGALTFDSHLVTKGYTVTGSTGNDTITLGSGADTIISVDGVDTIKAGGGNDTFKFEGNKLTATDTVWGEDGTADTIRFTSTVGTLSDAAFTLVQTVEKVVFEASTAQTFNYGDLAKAAGIATIDASAPIKITNTTANQAVLNIAIGDIVYNNDGNAINGIDQTYYKALTAQTRIDVDTIDFTDGVNWAVFTMDGFTLDSSALTGDASLNFIGTIGDDTFMTKSAYLTNSDRFTGNGGTDILEITDAATIIDTDFTYIKGVEKITLVDAVNSLTLGTQFQLSGITTIDASAVTTNTNTNSINMSGISKLQGYTIKGGDGADTITMKSAVFASNVTIDGNGATDIISISDKAIITDAQFALKSDIETIQIGNFAGNSITLGTNATAAGIVTVNGASMTSTTSTMTVNAIAMSSDKTMTLTGGAGNDIFMVTTDHLTTADTITGAGGTADKLIISGAGTALGDGDFTNVTSVETLAFATGSSYGVTFDAEAKGAGFTTVDASLLATADVFTFTTTSGFDVALTLKGGAGSDIITTTGATTNDIITAGAGDDIITSGAGTDTLDGGLGNDKFVFANANLSSADKITGGLGTDTIEVTDAFTYSTQFNSTTGVETLSLKAASTVVVNTSMNTAGFKTIDGSGSAGVINVDAKATTVGLTIKGGSAADFILGSKGNDTITGGTDVGVADTFEFTIVAKGNGHDTITDFQNGTDKLSLEFTTTTDSALGTRVNGAALSETDFNYYITDINYTDEGANIVLLGGDTITLTGINSGIDKADFFYAI